MRIYVADIQALSDEQLEELAVRFLTRERRVRAACYKNPQDYRRSICAGLLLEFGLRSLGYTLLEEQRDLTQLHVESGMHGKPYVTDAENFFFNLSHSGKYAAVVLADGEVGIDVERVRTANLAVARRFFTEEEKVYLQEIYESHGESETLDQEYIRLWTRKEGYIKAVGEGMHLPLHTFSVLSDIVSGEETYYLRSWKLEGDAMISVCSKAEIDAIPVMVELPKAFDDII